MRILQALCDWLDWGFRSETTFETLAVVRRLPRPELFPYAKAIELTVSDMVITSNNGFPWSKDERHQWFHVHVKVTMRDGQNHLFSFDFNKNLKTSIDLAYLRATEKVYLSLLAEETTKLETA